MSVAPWRARSSATPAWQAWLADRMSLTIKLMAASRAFRVQRLNQANAMCLADEAAALGLARAQAVRQREVILLCDGVPLVFAHTVVPLAATAADWPFFNSLGDRSLGTTLFGDPLVTRGALQYAKLRRRHPLAQRAGVALGMQCESWHARRCLYRRKQGLLLVTEVFSPAILALPTKQDASRPEEVLTRLK